MRIVFLLFTAMVKVFSCSGQQKSLGFVVQPSLSYYTIQSDFTLAAQQFRELHKPIFTFQAGFLYSKALSPAVSFITGAVYAQRGIQSQFNTSTIYAFNFSNSGFDVRVIDRFVEIPAILAINILKGQNVTWFGSVGLKPSVYINSTSKGGGISSTYYYRGHRTVNVMLSVGAGAKVNLSRQWYMLLWPTLEHAVLNETFAPPLKLYPYSLGFNLCFMYSLGN